MIVFGIFTKQLENLSHRESSLRNPVTITNTTKKFVHLTEEIVSYQKNRHPKPKENYTYTKKTSTTLLSPRFNTTLFSSDIGLLFDRDQCQVKAWLLRDSGTVQHEWIGSETNVNDYKTKIQHLNEMDEQQFITKVLTSRETNEVLAKINPLSLRAIIIQSDIPAERLKAIQHRDEIESKFSKHLPILFYKPTQKLKLYTLPEQERDQLNAREPLGSL
ncbi:MAG: hypothetical protein E6K54_05815 [Gammaproteobacteria bacterium]|nr:MAG: hypothetical protein E6K54_05815 [Gammaproteobacteria bacterium]